MTLHFPSSLQWLEWVVGSDWPDGDEDALWRLRDAWRATGAELHGLVGDGDSAALRATAAMDGASAEALHAYWAKFADGDDGYLLQLAQACEGLATHCDTTATEIEYAKYQFLIFLIILAWEISYFIAMVPATFGASAAGIAPAEVGAQLAVRALAQNVVKAIVESVVENVAADIVVQVIQLGTGHRTEFDGTKTINAALDGAVSGAIFGGLRLAGARLDPGNLAGRLGRDAAEGLVAGVASTVASSAIHGEGLSWEQLGKAGTSGLVGGIHEQGPHSPHNHELRIDLDGSAEHAGASARPLADLPALSDGASGSGDHHAPWSGDKLHEADGPTADPGVDGGASRPSTEDGGQHRIEEATSSTSDRFARALAGDDSAGAAGRLAGDETPGTSRHEAPTTVGPEPTSPRVTPGGAGPTDQAFGSGGPVGPVGPGAPGTPGGSPGPVAPAGRGVTDPNAARPGEATGTRHPETAPQHHADGAARTSDGAVQPVLTAPSAGPLLSDHAVRYGEFRDRGVSAGDIGWRGNEGRVLTTEQNSAADAFLERARVNEQVLTPRLREIADAVGGELYGEDHARKGEDSFKRKLADVIARSAARGIDEHVGLINDSVRYTVGLPERDYAADAHRVLAELASRGFEAVRPFTNYWAVDGGYQGINSIWRDPHTGQVFEVQVHTADSFHAKSVTHDLYQVERTTPDPTERARLAAEQDRVFGAVPVPHGAAGVRIPDHAWHPDHRPSDGSAHTVRVEDGGTAGHDHDDGAHRMADRGDPDQHTTEADPDPGPRFVTDAQAIDLVRDHLHATPSGYGIYPHNDEMRAFADAVPPRHAVVNLDLHASPDGFHIDGHVLSGEQFARAVDLMVHEGRITLGPGDHLRLAACEAGRGPDSPAARFARTSGRSVSAPTERLWSNLRGDEVLSSGRVSDGRWVPTHPPDGHWRSFEPDGPESGTPQPSAHGLGVDGHDALPADRASDRPALLEPGWTDRGGRPERYLRDSDQIPAGRWFHEPGHPADDAMRRAAHRIAPDPDHYTLALHGDADGVYIGGRRLTAAEFADLIRADPYWDGRPIRLNSCETGTGGDHAFAQVLADQLGVEVVAPDRPLWTRADGSSTVASITRDANGRMIPVHPPDGDWHTFVPDSPRATGRAAVPQPVTDPASGAHPWHGTEPTHGPAPVAWDRSWEPAELLDAATQLRTDRGQVDPQALSTLLDQLPTIEVPGAVARSATLLQLTDHPAFSAELAGAYHDALQRFATESLADAPAGLELRRVGGEGEDGKGASGAPVYILRDGNGPVAIVKVFPRAEEMGQEMSALHRLGSPEFRSQEARAFGTPELRTAATIRTDAGTYGVLVTSVARGTAVDDLVAAVSRAEPHRRQEAMQTLRAAVEGTASALAALHTRPDGSNDSTSAGYVANNTPHVHRYLDRIVAERSFYERHGLDVDRLSARIEELAAGAARSPGAASLVHGDAHPGNVFYEPGSGRITFIDTPGAHLAMDSTGGPIGSPARDIAHFEERLRHFGSDAGLSRAEQEQLRRAFAGTYRREGQAPEPDVLAMFRARCVLRELLEATPPPGLDVDEAQQGDIDRRIKAHARFIIDALRLQEETND